MREWSLHVTMLCVNGLMAEGVLGVLRQSYTDACGSQAQQRIFLCPCQQGQQG